jgi:hypothetical protein
VRLHFWDLYTAKAYVVQNHKKIPPKTRSKGGRAAGLKTLSILDFESETMGKAVAFPFE